MSEINIVKLSNYLKEINLSLEEGSKVVESLRDCYDKNIQVLKEQKEMEKKNQTKLNMDFLEISELYKEINLKMEEYRKKK